MEVYSKSWNFKVQTYYVDINHYYYRFDALDLQRRANSNFSPYGDSYMLGAWVRHGFNSSADTFTHSPCRRPEIKNYRKMAN